jgi:hypothetical protein
MQNEKEKCNVCIFNFAFYIRVRVSARERSSAGGSACGSHLPALAVALLALRTLLRRGLCRPVYHARRAAISALRSIEPAVWLMAIYK